MSDELLQTAPQHDPRGLIIETEIRNRMVTVQDRLYVMQRSLSEDVLVRLERIEQMLDELLKRTEP